MFRKLALVIEIFIEIIKQRDGDYGRYSKTARGCVAFRLDRRRRDWREATGLIKTRPSVCVRRTSAGGAASISSGTLISSGSAISSTTEARHRARPPLFNVTTAPWCPRDLSREKWNKGLETEKQQFIKTGGAHGIILYRCLATLS
ncbi:hypothetical protein EVAR_33468_1 [Eumeta japonica]|uniref:Uncharacterized protein n=1 Tax=Eumeta variegata TaxID=151549 RepID=A0A4C1WHX5_EUMVA|nr:hypothetical protein EVAR_33468_1 [Eumeta japonica]